MMYTTQERIYNMTCDVGDHGMPIQPPPTLCSCGKPKERDRAYCFPCTDLIDDACALGE